MVVAGLSVVGFVRSVVVVSPVAGDLPEPLRSEGPRLAGFRSLREATAPPRRGRDGAWGPTHRYRLVPAEGNPVLVELVVYPNPCLLQPMLVSVLQDLYQPT